MHQRQALELTTRLGFAARGLLYLIIAWLLIGSGRTVDLGGALEYLRGERALLFAIIIGFVGYGVWRLLDAAVDSEGHGDDKKGALARLGAGASGIIYLFLAWQAWRIVKGGEGGSGGQPEQQAETVMNLPGGTILILLGAIILFLAGLWQLKRAISCSFCKHLRPEVRQKEWVRWMGRGGYGARGVIFLVTAYFLLNAALSGNSREAGGMQDVLRWLESPVNLIVAAGLALFGLFSILESIYRDIHPAPVGAITDRLT